MTNSEHDIDQVLAALRDTQPTQGLEQRLLARMEETHEASPRRHAWLWPTIAATAATALIFTVISQQGRQRSTKSHVAVTASSANPTPTTPSLVPPSQQVARSIRHIVPPPAARFGREKIVLAAASLNDADLIAMENTRAPSHPAPPMPLTAEERLLARAARKKEGIIMAELEPLPRPSRDAALQRFVERNLAPIVLAESFHPTPPQETTAETPQVQTTDTPQ